MSRVFVTQPQVGKDLSQAEEFGKLVYCSNKNEQVTHNTVSNATKYLSKALADFDYATDYLLLIGDPVLIGLACSIVSETTIGRYNVLKWVKQEKRYEPITIDLGVSA
jgi:hypothetical protein